MEPPKFCGIISQRYRPRSGNPAKSFQQWIDKIKDSVIKDFVPALSKVSARSMLPARRNRFGLGVVRRLCHPSRLQRRSGRLEYRVKTITYVGSAMLTIK